MDLFQKEKKLVEGLKRWDKETIDHALYTQLFLSNDDILELMNYRKLDEFTKRDFLACIFRNAISPGDVQFIEFNDLFHPKLIYVSMRPDENTVGVSSYRDVYDKPNDKKALFIIKTTGENADVNAMYHEAFVGIFGTNKLIEKIPNFMFVYNIIPNCSIQYDEHFCFTKGDNGYLIAEKVSGVSLDDFLGYKIATEAVVFSIFIQIINALYIAKEACNFIHGDLHSKNIIIETLKEEIHIPLYLESDNPTTYITTKYVARMIDFEFSNITYKNKNYNGLETIYSERYISCISDLYKLLGSMYWGLLNKGNMIQVLTDAYNHTVKAPNNIVYYFNQVIRDEVKDRYVPFTMLSNTILKDNVDFSYRDYYGYIKDTYPELFAEIKVVKGDKKAFVHGIYNYPKKIGRKTKHSNDLLDIVSHLNGPNPSLSKTVSWSSMSRALGIENDEMREKATKQIMDRITTKDIRKEINNFYRYTNAITNRNDNELEKKYQSIPKTKRKKEKANLIKDVVDEITSITTQKIGYLSSYINLLHIIRILNASESGFDPIKKEVRKVLSKEESSRVLQLSQTMDAKLHAMLMKDQLILLVNEIIPAAYINTISARKSIEQILNYNILELSTMKNS